MTTMALTPEEVNEERIIVERCTREWVAGKYAHVRERLDVIVRAAFDDDVDPELLPAIAMECIRMGAHVEELDRRIGRVERALARDVLGPDYDW